MIFFPFYISNMFCCIQICTVVDVLSAVRVSRDSYLFKHGVLLDEWHHVRAGTVTVLLAITIRRSECKYRDGWIGFYDTHENVTADVIRLEGISSYLQVNDTFKEKAIKKILIRNYSLEYTTINIIDITSLLGSAQLQSSEDSSVASRLA